MPITTVQGGPREPGQAQHGTGRSCDRVRLRQARRLEVAQAMARGRALGGSTLGWLVTLGLALGCGSSGGGSEGPPPSGPDGPMPDAGTADSTASTDGPAALVESAAADDARAPNDASLASDTTPTSDGSGPRTDGSSPVTDASGPACPASCPAGKIVVNWNESAPGFPGPMGCACAVNPCPDGGIGCACQQACSVASPISTACCGWMGSTLVCAECG
jgi:hypothetical protein